MSAAEQPGFRHLADEDDDPQWWSGTERPRQTRTALPSDIGPLFGNGVPPEAPPAAPSRRASPLIVGAGLAVATAALLATPLLLRAPSHPQAVAAPTLKVTRHQPADTPVTPRRSLPCYVNGVSVGALPLMDCAARNGVASGSLDVGLQRPGPETSAPASVQVAQANVVARVPVAASRSTLSSAALGDRRSPDRSAAPPRAAPDLAANSAPSEGGWRRALRFFPVFASRPHPVEALPRPRLASLDDRTEARARVPAPRPALHAGRLPGPTSETAGLRRNAPEDAGDDMGIRGAGEEDGPTAAESALAADDFYRALGRADGARAASLVVPEKRHGGPLSSQAIDRFYSSLRAPLRVTSLRPLDNHHVAVRYQFVDPDGMLCSGDSEVATTVRDERVLVQSIHTHSRC